MLAIPSGTPQPFCHLPVLREHDSILGRVRIISIPNKRDTFVYFNDCAVKWQRAANVQVKDAGTRLVAYKRKVL